MSTPRRAVPFACRRAIARLPDLSRSAAGALALLAVLAPWPAPARADAQRAAEVLPSIVSVLPQWPANRVRNQEPEGSGVAVLDGRHVITALHVVAPALSVRIRTAGGAILAAELVGRDEATDLALLRVGEELPALALDAEPRLGEEVCALGNAFGLGISLSCGVVSALHRTGVGFNPVEDFVQTDAAVNPGASGGALVNGEGAVVGILSAIFTKQSDANLGVNFAVPARLAGRVARELKDEGRVRWLAAGMRLAAVPGQGETGRMAARVVAVGDATPAALAGLAVDDLIIAAGGRAVRAPADLIAALAYLSAPAELPVTVLRGGTERSLTLRFGKAE